MRTQSGETEARLEGRRCALPKLEQLIDSVAEGLEGAGRGRRGGGGSAGVCSPNLRPQDAPLFGLPALEGKGWAASPGAAAPAAPPKPDRAERGWMLR